MVVTAVVGLLALRPGSPAPILSPSTTTTAAVTSTTGPATTASPSNLAVPATEGVLIATPEDGIVISGFDGVEGRLTSDLYYEPIAWVISDGAGGIIFQHEVTPLPWPQGTILHLAAGAVDPIQLVVPEPETYLRPLDTDSGLVLYRVDSGGSSEVRAIDPATGSVHTVVPPTEFLVGAAADDGVVVSAIGGDCPRFEVFNLEGTDPPVPDWVTGECNAGFINDIAFAGGSVYTIEDGESRSLVRRDFSTGDTSTTPIGDAWAVAALADGTVAFVGTEIVVGSFDGGSLDGGGFVENARVPAGNTFTLAAIDGFPAGATLGTGTAELPCTPVEVPEVDPQGLPQAVEDKRAMIFKMAAACDMEGLAAIVLADQASFTYGGETDPLRSWIYSARTGFDVMAWIVRLFNSVPAVDDAGTYAWPAVHVTNSDEDWDELSGILTAAEFESYSAYRDGGWLGLRIGIADDGTWRFVVAGD